MLCVDADARLDIDEVAVAIQALAAGKPLPPRYYFRFITCTYILHTYSTPRLSEHITCLEWHASTVAS